MKMIMAFSTNTTQFLDPSIVENFARNHKKSIIPSVDWTLMGLLYDIAVHKTVQRLLSSDCDHGTVEMSNTGYKTCKQLRPVF